MNEVTKFDPDTGEVIATGVAALEAGSAPLAVQIARVELDQAISTAKAYPRSLTRVRDNIDALVMLDDETAAECVYALPRGGKPIKGPSVRFAEIVASQFGNCKVGSRVVDVNRFEKYIEAEGVFIDLEAGMTRTARTRRRISDKHGKLFNDDMIVVTGNAACSIALREAILKGVPKALWRRAYEAAEAVISGDVKTLSQRRGDAIKAFATFGVTPEQVFAALEVEGLDDIGLDEIGTLTAMFRAIKAGEQAVEDFFPAKVDPAKAKEAAKGTAAKLADIAATGKQKEAAPEAKAGEPAGSAKDTTSHAPSSEDQQETAKSTTADADLDAAKARGAEARKKGMPRKAVPGEYREDERLSGAWLAGYDEQAAASTKDNAS